MNQIASQPLPEINLSQMEALCKAGLQAGIVRDAIPLTKLEHSFIPGGYARSLWRPRGTLIVGKRHKHACFTFLMSGRLTVWTENESKELIAPAFFVSPAGVRKVTFAREDSLLITVHATAETDLAKLETELTVPDIQVELPESVKSAIAQLTGDVK